MFEATTRANDGDPARPIPGLGRRVARAMLAWLAVPAFVVALPAGSADAATTLTVNSTDDGTDVAPGDGTCADADGQCTLRAAIEEANAQPGPNTINFGLQPNQIHTITIDETLTISDRSGGLTIDGYSQNGASPNTDALLSNAQILINLTTTAELAPMVQITSAANTIRGLAIYGNGSRIELLGEDADGNRFLGNFIGTDSTGTETSTAPEAQRGIDAGIVMNLGPDRNVIGTTDPADRNVLVANSGYGIRINHGETSQNVIENNIIGLGPTGAEVGLQRIGIDIQWWSWGAYVTGNLLSGNEWYGIDLSHSTVGNTVVDNRFGTEADGNTASPETANGRGIAFKDNPVNNFVADNVIGNSVDEGLWHKHNYSGANTVVRNRIGVGAAGGAVGNGSHGVELRGHDDLFQDNIVANNAGAGVVVSDTTSDNGANYPAEATLGNVLSQNTYYRNGGLNIDFENDGQNPNDDQDDDGTHAGLNHPEITGIGPGEIYGTACSGCRVEVYVSGQVNADGTIDTVGDATGTGASWVGTAVAGGNGNWSLAHPDLNPGKLVTTLTIDSSGNTSETSPTDEVPSTMTGTGSNAGPSTARVESPATPGRPPAHEADVFTCSWADGTLSWDDEGAAEYYVRSIDADGTERYLGGRTGTSTTVPSADGYRVVNWSRGYARSATCDGPGDPVGPSGFTCEFNNGTLSWSDIGAPTYYLRLVDGSGTDSYFGSATGTSAAVPDSAAYVVIHWDGPSRLAAECPGG